MERKRFRKILLGAAAFVGGATAIGGVTYLVVEGEGGQGSDQVFNPDSPSATGTIEGTVIAGIEPTPTPTPTRVPGSTGEFTPTPPPRPTDLFTPTPTPEPTDLWTPPGTVWVTPTPWTPKPTQPPIYPTPTPIRTPEPTIRPTAPPTPEPTLPEIQEGFNYEWANYLFDRINQVREENVIPALMRNNLLDLSAQNYSKFLFSAQGWGHDLDGSPQDRAERVGYSAFWVGEILAGRVPTITTAEAIMQGWLSSPGHKAAILSFPNPEPDLRIVDLGIGCYQAIYRDGGPLIICAGEFGIPQG